MRIIVYMWPDIYIFMQCDSFLGKIMFFSLHVLYAPQLSDLYSRSELCVLYSNVYGIGQFKSVDSSELLA